ncbi:TPA: hypothetical protein HA278_03350 [Candidatus Woesearchaeota archaeon]|nr:hypothetical protein [archaeon]HIJ11070.1 hypothetical protein [Candidatus Woesearchaeota archaeon]
MTRESHMEQVERWAKFVRDNPTKWQKPHAEFIDALFQNQKRVLLELLKQPNGKEKIIKLYNIKNIKGYSFLQP